MRRKKPLILSLVGARPQFIKLAPLARALSARFKHVIIHSGQHYDHMMSDIFFRQLAIPKVHYNLSVGSGNHGEMTAAIMSRLEKLLLKLQPDLVLVYGDTNSTLAGALCAAKLNIPVGHVEAGLRSYRMDMPEEINRRLTDHISGLLFCPTGQAISNLKKEGITAGVFHSGDLMYQLIDQYRNRISRNREVLRRFQLIQREYLLMTLHRAANVDDGDVLGEIVDIIGRLDRKIIFPVHPRTMKNLRCFNLLGRLKKTPNIILTGPVSYLDSLTLTANAGAVMTDSGGVQKEAVFLNSPCLTLRDETEWVETLDWGNHLVGLSLRKISRHLQKLSRPRKQVPLKIRGQLPSDIITAAILSYFKDF